jgi:hypothetical protein
LASILSLAIYFFGTAKQGDLVTSSAVVHQSPGTTIIQSGRDVIINPPPRAGNDLVAENDTRRSQPKELRSTKQKAVQELYYGDRKLNGRTITLGLSNPDRRVCETMHVWDSTSTGIPDSFALCGIWMKKPDEAVSLTAFGTVSHLFVDLSEEIITDSRQQCRLRPERPDPGYLSLRFRGIRRTDF